MKKTTISLENVPFHRKIPHSTFTIDYFKHTVINISGTFLSHYHADHYYGLTKSHKTKIYCSETTANLILKFINVNPIYLHILKINVLYKIDNLKVFCYEANHCPGAFSFIFSVNNSFFLHSGDFRFDFNVHFLIHDYLRFVRENDGQFTQNDIKYKENKESIECTDNKDTENKNDIKENIFNKNSIECTDNKFLENKNDIKYKENKNSIECTDNKFLENKNDIKYKENKNSLECTDNKNSIECIDNKYLENTQNNIKENIKNNIKENVKNDTKENLKNTYFNNKDTFDLVFLDNTYENYKNFPSQKKVINLLISDIKKILFPKNKLLPIKTKIIFSSYFIGKEKLFLSVAYFFQMKVYLNKRKFDALNCFCDYTRNLINKNVIEICDEIKDEIKDENSAVKNRNYFKRLDSEQKNKIKDKIKDENSAVKNMNYFKRLDPEIKDKIKDEIQDENSAFKNMNYFKRLDPEQKDKIKDENKKLLPLDLIFTENRNKLNKEKNDFQNDDKILDVLQFNQISKKKLSELYQNSSFKKLIIIMGTGWSKKKKFFDFKKKDLTIKNGIEILQVPYSEHSSSAELDSFRKFVRNKGIVASVNFKNDDTV